MLWAFLSQLYILPSLSAASCKGNTVEVSKAELYFPPKDDPVERIVSLIDGAQVDVLVQAYNFNITAISSALKRAHQRHVHVLLLVDKSQIKGTSDIPALAKEGLEVWIDHRPPIAHNKVIVVDAKHIVHGSFNYSKLANKYAENCMIYIDESKAALLFTANIKKRLALSKKWDVYLSAKAAKKRVNQSSDADL